MSPQYAGMPEDNANRRELGCGCVLLRVALRGNPEIYLRKCEEHDNELPVITTHAEWCRHLSKRNLLAPDHVKCKTNDYCVSYVANETIAAFRKEGKRL